MKRIQSDLTTQLTIRGVPMRVKQLLHERARLQGKSLNEVLVEALCVTAGAHPSDMGYNDLDELAGKWVEDAKFQNAILAQDQIDESLWP